MANDALSKTFDKLWLEYLKNNPKIQKYSFENQIKLENAARNWFLIGAFEFKNLLTENLAKQNDK